MNNNHSLQSEEEEQRPLMNSKQEYYTKRSQELKDRKRSEEFINKYYSFFSLVAGLLLGAQVFLYQVLINLESDNLSLSLCLPQFLGWLIVYGIYQIKEMIVCYSRYGKLWIRERSSYFYTSQVTYPLRQHEGRTIQHEDFDGYSGSSEWNYFNIVGLVIRTIVGLGCDLMKFGVMYTATLAGVQYSLITNLYSIIPFLCSVSFYFFFKERVGKFHIIGMILIFACLIILSYSQGDSSSSTDTSTRMPIIVPLMLALLASIFFTINTVVGRYWVSKKQITIQQLMSDSYLLKGLIFLAIFCFVDYPFDSYTIYAVAGITVIEALGMYLLSEAMIHGMAGPGYALHEVQSPFTLLLEIYFLSKYPSILQIIGYVVGLLGGGVIALETNEKKEEEAEDSSPSKRMPGN